MKFLPILRGEIGVIQGMWARVWLVCRAVSYTHLTLPTKRIV